MALTCRPSDYLMEDNILHDTSHWLLGAVDKPGKEPSLAANYRPISLLSVLQAPGASCTHAFLPQSKVYSVQTRLVSGKVEALVTRLLPSPLSSKWIPAEPKDWRHLSGLNSSI